VEGSKPIWRQCVGDQKRRIRILDAAETLFAAKGFIRASLRAIARTAQVDLALINHHYGCKEDLFKAVLARRADVIHRERLETLEDCRARSKGIPPIEELVQAFVDPLFTRAQASDEWRDYLKLVARLSVEREWMTTLAALYNPTAKYFINAMRMACPKATEERLFWAYQFLLGSMVYTGADCGRIDNLSDGVVRSNDLRVAHQQLLMFVSAGIRAILADDKALITRYK
jgi:AcrR family transcriptional regulator